MDGTFTERHAYPCRNHTPPKTLRGGTTDWCENCGGMGHIDREVTVSIGTDDPLLDRKMASARAIGVLKGLLDAQAFRSPESHEQARLIVAEYEHAQARIDASVQEVAA